MKIGILSIIPNNNYGGVIQGFALQKYLSKKGNEVFIILRNSNKKFFFHKISNFLKVKLGLVQKTKNDYNIIGERFRYFDQHIKKFRP